MEKRHKDLMEDHSILRDILRDKDSTCVGCDGIITENISELKQQISERDMRLKEHIQTVRCEHVTVVMTRCQH